MKESIITVSRNQKKERGFVKESITNVLHNPKKDRKDL